MPLFIYPFIYSQSSLSSITYHPDICTESSITVLVPFKTGFISLDFNLQENMADPKVLAFTATTHHESYPAIATSTHNGHIVLVTGASKGLGRAAAIKFAKAGARAIIIAARSDLDEVEKEIYAAVTNSTSDAAAGARSSSNNNSSPQVLKLRLDVTNEADVAKAAAQVQQTFGKVDILVNNAGYMAKWIAIDESNADEWWRTWEVNLKGVYLVTRAFLPLVRQSEQTKTIVNLSSIAAHVMTPGASAYQTTKLALLRLTEFMALENGEKGVTAFSIHPGAVPTEMAGNLPDFMQEKMIDPPELAADTISWLTQERQQWLNGRYISAVWDMPELFARKEEIVAADKLKVRLVV